MPSAEATKTAAVPPVSGSLSSGNVSEQLVGPLTIGMSNYTLALRQQVPTGGKPSEGLTVVGLEIRDHSGATRYTRSFHNTVQMEGFVDTLSIYVHPLVGPSTKGMLLSYVEDSEPSAPEPESSAFWQIFGEVGGKLAAFSAPIEVQGDLLPVEAASVPVPGPQGSPITAPADTLYFKVWAGRFRLIYPVRIDWIHGKLAPGDSCANVSSPQVPWCEFNVLPENERHIQDVTFVTLCATPTDPCPKPERTIVKPTSSVPLLSARAQVQLDPGRSLGPAGDPSKPMDESGSIRIISKDLWLKIIVDGKEGWIHSMEDFDALQMPSEQ